MVCSYFFGFFYIKPFPERFLLKLVDINNTNFFLINTYKVFETLQEVFEILQIFDTVINSKEESSMVRHNF
jgi:hypothetical protein